MDHKMLGLSIELTQFPSFHLRWNSFNSGHDRVVAAVHRKCLFFKECVADIIYAPLIPVMGQLMLHFIDEWEVFAVISHLLARTAWLDHCKAQFDASHSTLISLIHSHSVKLTGLLIAFMMPL